MGLAVLVETSFKANGGSLITGLDGKTLKGIAASTSAIRLNLSGSSTNAAAQGSLGNQSWSVVPNDHIVVAYSWQSSFGPFGPMSK